ncbi:MAG: transcription termination factor NusA [Pseudomonadota bacterium]|nr:transcription termination factor NusA [Pseudomonadota bacterium]
MSKEILLVVEALSNEKGVDEEVIFRAIEAALESAARKRMALDEVDVQVRIDRRTGAYTTTRRWEVVTDDAEEINPLAQITLSEARAKQPKIEVGEFVEESLESLPFGRIAAQAAKQVIVQKVREAERAKIVDQYRDRVGELVMGMVKKVERGNVILDLGGNVEAIVPREWMIPREMVHTGDRLRGYLKDVRSESRGPQLFLSRTAPEFLVELFKLEVPEVGQGLIEIKGAARDPGLRAKIAVMAHDRRIDPVGACVGMRGSRVQTVSNELSGERIDIVPWDSNPVQFVINAMSPADVVSIVVDEESHSMDVAVDADKLSLAIGRGGQNVRLASELTGWTLNVMDQEQAHAKSEAEANNLINLFVREIGVDEEIAAILVREGFSSVEEVAYVPAGELLEIEEFDEEVVNALREAAKDALLTRAIATEEHVSETGPAQDLLDLGGMDPELAHRLARNGIQTREDLAEQAVDDLIEIEALDRDRAAALIMTAREHWFADQQG